jgi:hypothetical protein
MLDVMNPELVEFLAENYPLLAYIHAQGVLDPPNADWLPKGWGSEVYPMGECGDDNLDAVVQWLSYNISSRRNWAEASREFDPGDTLLAADGGAPVRDAHRLVRYLQERRQWIHPPARPTREFTCCPEDSEAVVEELTKVQRWIEEQAAAGRQQGEETNRYAALEGLSARARKAYYSFLYAEWKAEKRLEDREAHDWLHEYGIDPDEEHSGELVDYVLPAFDTWSRYLRIARNALNEQKYSPRWPRQTGRSIVNPDEV